MLAPVGFIELGPSDNLALDQPLVAVELLEDVNPDPEIEEWISLGPSIFNTLLLDTGANSILMMATAVDDLQTSGRYETQGEFLEVGVGGYHLLDISAPYRFDFAGTDGVRNTISNETHIMSDATKDFSMFGPWGLVGMPAMAGRVTSLDMTVWSGGSTGLDTLHMTVDFAEQVPAGDEHRYALAVDNRIWFETDESIVYGQPPVWADVPFLTATLANDGISAAGNFLFDTGAQISVLSTRLARDIGLDSNGDGQFDDNDAYYVTSETVAGVGGEISVPVFAIDELYVTVTQVATGNEVDLMWTNLQWLVLDIGTGSNELALDGVFGSDLLTSGWFNAFFYPGMPDGYFDRVHFDFTDWSLDDGTHETRAGTIYFDVNDVVDQVLPYGPGLRIRESDRTTEVIEGVMTDTYSIALSTIPAAPVQVTITADDQLLVSADGGATYSPSLVLTFTDRLAQTITVAAIEDGLQEGIHTGVITHSVASADAGYDGILARDVTARILDYTEMLIFSADEAGQDVISWIDVTEGAGKVTYWMRLSEPLLSETWVVVEEPTNEVSINNPTNTLPGFENVWIFNVGNWQVPQQVEITVTDDNVPEEPHEAELIHTTVDASSFTIVGQNFLTARIADDDAGGVRITELDGNILLTEDGATDSYEIGLTKEPSGPVQITVTADTQVQVSADGGATYASTLVLTFTDLATQTVTVRAIDDAVAESTHFGTIRHAITGTIHDPMYPALLPVADVKATIVDNDEAGLSLAADAAGQHPISAVELVEGADSRYWIALTSQPKHDVMVFLGSVHEQVVVVSDADPDSAALTFTPHDWNQPQAVRVTAIDEAVVEGPHTDYITHTLFSSDQKYQGSVLLRADIDDPPPQVAARHIFYNRSAWDGRNPAATDDDDAAIASDKAVLLPGQKATFANYTSYNHGINGLMIDVRNLRATPTADDFVFRAGNDNQPYGTNLDSPDDDWRLAPEPISITVRAGAGVDGADRVTLIWPDGAIQKCWLQVTLVADDTNGLLQNDVFYVGNAVGESGNSTGNALVNATDEIGARNNPHSPFNPAPKDDRFDFNRDKLVNAADQIIARNNRTSPFNALKLITPPLEPVSGSKGEAGASSFGGKPHGAGDAAGSIDRLGPQLSPFLVPVTTAGVPTTLNMGPHALSCVNSEATADQSPPTASPNLPPDSGSPLPERTPWPPTGADFQLRHARQLRKVNGSADADTYLMHDIALTELVAEHE